MDGMGDLSSIPMPPTESSSDVSGGTSSENEAWKKAQEALQQIRPSTSSTPAQQPMDIRAMTMAAYPWMTQYSMGFPTESVFARAPTQTPSWVPPTQSSPFRHHQPQPRTYGSPPGGGLYQEESGPRFGSHPVKPGNMINLPPPGVVTSPRLAGRGGYGGSRGGWGSGMRGPAWRRSGGPTFQHNQRQTTGGNMEPLGGGKMGGFSSPGVLSPQQTGPKKAPSESGGSQQTMPPGVTEYIERAYMAAENEVEKNKVEKALKDKLMPLLQSGAAWKIHWDNEPLPTEAGFTMSWKRGAQPLRGGVRGGREPGRNIFGGPQKRGAWPGTGRQRNTRESPPRRRKRASSGSSGGGSSVRSVSPADRSGSSRSGRKKAPRPRFRPQASDESDSETPTMSSVSSALSGRLGTRKQKQKGKQQHKKVKSQLEFSAPTGDARKEAEMKAKRAQRFANHINQPIKKRMGGVPKVLASRVKRPFMDDLDDDFMFDYSPKREETEVNLGAFIITGTCEDVEKPFLRLTAAPDASQVRPPGVLEKSLSLVKRKWRDTQDYYYACDQLKSIRQDITADREEFNQCQTQLRSLYKETGWSENEYEFTAYRLMYYIYMENSMDLTTSIAELSPEAKRDSCILFAMKVRKAWSLQSYHRLFKCYSEAPRMSSYVMDLFIERERKNGLKRILKAYRPSVPISFVAKELGFFDEAACKEWATPLVKALDPDGIKIDCRQGVTY